MINHLGNRIDRDRQHASWPTEQEARTIAQANQAADPEWTYDVAMRPDCRYVVVVTDENGNLLGFL